MTTAARLEAAILAAREAGDALVDHAAAGKPLLRAYGDALRELRAARDAAMERRSALDIAKRFG